MGQSVAESIIGEGRGTGCVSEGDQAIGGIVGIGVHAVVEQVAVIVPGVEYAIYSRQTIGVVIDVCVIAEVGLLGEAVADGIVGVVIVFSVAVIRSGQAVKFVVRVVDRHRLRFRGRHGCEGVCWGGCDRRRIGRGGCRCIGRGCGRRPGDRRRGGLGRQQRQLRAEVLN